MPKLHLILAALALSACSRWNDLPAHFSEQDGTGVAVSEIQTAPNEYDLRAKMTDFLGSFDDPLQIKLPLENAARARATQLCEPRKLEVTAVAQQPPVTDVFMHVICR